MVAIGMTRGTNAGYAINPDRDFGPRLASFITGYDTGFEDQHGSFYFSVPIVAPLIGGLLGAGGYKVLISQCMPDDDEPGEMGEIPTAEPHVYPTPAVSPRS